MTTQINGTGNLTIEDSRIKGDFSNATIANRVMLQTSTVNGNTVIGAIPNGTSDITSWRAFDSTDVVNARFIELRTATSQGDARINVDKTGTGTYLPMTFYTGGAERMRIDTAGNVLVGTTSAGSTGISISASSNYTVAEGANSSLFNLFRQTSSGATVIANGYKQSANANAFASSYGSSWAKTAISLGAVSGAITFYTDAAATTAVGTDVTPTERMRIDSSGNVLVTNPGGLGYGTGAGGTVTQATSKGTAVTLNRPTGRITTAADALGASNTVSFVFNNSVLGANDVLQLSLATSGSISDMRNYNIWSFVSFAGVAIIAIRNISGGSLSEALQINFAIIKGAAA